MQILKRVGLMLLAVVVLLLVVSLFLPSRVHVERSRVLKARPDAVFAQVNDLRNWFNWMPWNKVDPNMKIAWGAVTEGPEAKYAWESENKEVGQGSITIVKSDPNRMVQTDMDFMDHGKATGEFILEEQPDGTKVTWTMDSEMGMNPVFKFMGLFMDKMVGPDFEKGLKDLDNVAQANPVAAPEEQAVSTPTDSTQATAEPSKS